MMIREDRSEPAPRRRASRVVAALACSLAVLASSSWAAAAWTSPATGAGTASSTTVPAGPQPTVSVVGRNVTVTWPTTTLTSGDAVSGYRVRRYAASGQAASVGSSCASVQTVLSCTEAAVAPGSWAYRVSALAGSWSGAEGAAGTAVVAPPTFTVSAGSAVTGSPGTVTGTIRSYVGPASLTFRLDNATTGQVLTGAPTSVPVGGQTDVTVTLPAGVTGGSRTIYAIGGGGDVVGAQILVDATPPSPTSIVTGDGGGNAGSAEPGDWLEVTFSEPLRANSICAAWAEDGTAKSMASGVTVSIANNGSATSADLLSVAAPGCGSGGLRFGTVDLGAKGYVRNGTTASFGATGVSSTITWDPATSKLRLVFGAASANRFGTVQSSTVSYAPDPALTDLRGLAVTGTASRQARQL